MFYFWLRVAIVYEDVNDVFIFNLDLINWKYLRIMLLENLKIW